MEPVQRGDQAEGSASLTSEISVDGDIVTKLHRRGTDPQALRERLRVASRVPELLSPLSTEPERVGDRWQTRWPRIEMVPEDPAWLPWADAGTVLARLHREPIDTAQPQGASDRVRRALGHRVDVPEREPGTLVHGDFHLGQLGWFDGEWLLIDIDDLGVGDPAWDLSRPAGFWAAGIIPDRDWFTFVDGYREAGGPAIPGGDPWPVLEPFARAAVLAAAALHPEDALLAAARARIG